MMQRAGEQTMVSLRSDYLKLLAKGWTEFQEPGRAEPISNGSGGGLTGEQIAADPAVRAAFVPVSRPGSLAVLSDSINALDQASLPRKVTRNLLGFLTINSRQRVRHGGIFGTGGFTLAQIRDTHLPQVLALSPKPEACLIAGGTNDATNLSAGIAALGQIIDALLAAGIRPVLWLVPPREDSAKSAPSAWNARIRGIAALRGLQVVDGYTPLASPAGVYKTAGLKQDTVHPSAAGHFALASALIADPGWLARFGDCPPYLTAATGDAVNLIGSDRGLFTSDGNGDGASDGWATWGATSYTSTRVTDADGYVWQRLTKAAATSGQGGYQLSVTTGFAVGDTVSLAGRIRTSGPDLGIAVSVEARAGTTTVSSIEAVNMIAVGGSLDGIFYGQGVVPATTDSLRVNFQITNGAVAAESHLEVARLTLLNRTALGLA